MNATNILYTLLIIIMLNSELSLGQDRPLLNKINPSFIINLQKSDDQILFHYILSNGITAEQPIWSLSLHLAPEITILTLSSPNRWKGNYLNENGDLMIHWGTPTDADVQPGQSLSGYSISAVSMPGIVPYYAEGWVPSPDSIVEDHEQDSIYHNLTPYGPGVVGKTIGPAPIPNPFIPLDFLDTLTSYTTQSRSLGWIKDETTAAKYLGYFSSAKTSLQQNNINSTQAMLNRVLNDVNIDSTSNLTSEAYALIKYNTEYLLTQLPAPPSLPSPPQLLDTLSAHLQMCYTNGWLGNKQFKEMLERNIQEAKKKYQRQDSIGCALELEDFQQIIKREYLARPKKNDRRYINGEAYRLLTSDITNIISNVLTLPPRTTAAISDQITSLQTELKRAEREQLMGGKLLVPALNRMLEIAKKELQKKDSLRASLQITLFQQTVREVYELSQKITKSKNYIKPQAFISLYYRAKYVLEQLPSAKNQNLPKLEKELEKELRGGVVE